MSSHAKEVATILVNYNSEYDVRQKCSDLSEVSEVFVVDNSRSKSLQQWCTDRDITYVSNDNTGYGGGNNVGARRAIEQGFEALLILNPDTEITPSSVVELERKRRESGFDILFPRVTDENGNELYDIPTLENRLLRAMNLLPDLPTGVKGVRPIDHGPGACMLISVETFDSLGGLNEDMFIYFDEVDFCYRARRSKKKIGLVDSISVIHEEPYEGTRYEEDYQFYLECRNRIITSFQFSTIGQIIALLIFFAAIQWHVVRLIFEGKRSIAYSGMKGLWDGLRGETGPPPYFSNV